MNPTIEDVVMANRYLYYVKAESFLSDREYDILERVATCACGSESPVHHVGSSSKRSYSPEQIRVAEYMKLGCKSK